MALNGTRRLFVKNVYWCVFIVCLSPAFCRKVVKMPLKPEVDHGDPRLDSGDNDITDDDIWRHKDSGKGELYPTVEFYYDLDEEERFDLKNGIKEAGDTEFTYALAIVARYRTDREDKDTWIPICSGALIDPMWLLTAASCVTYNRTIKGATKMYPWGRHVVMDPLKFQVVGGSASMYSKNATLRNVTQVIVNPKFALTSNFKLDLALLKLEQSFNMTSPYISTIRLSDLPWSSEAEECVVPSFGTGHRYGQPLRDRVYTEILTMHGAKACPCLFRKQRMYSLCMKPVPGKGICTGDTGAVLVCQGEAYGVAHGVIDRTTCRPKGAGAKCRKKNSYSVFMFICPHLNWLKMYVIDVPPKPLSCMGSTYHVFIFLILFLITLSRFL